MAMPTIYDVARAAGVSPATVSFVLNDGPRPVSAETKKRVLAAIEALSFRRSAAARSLARRRLDHIGVSFPSMGLDLHANSYGVAVIDGILGATEAHGYDVLLITQRQRAFEETFHRGRMDGALLVIPPPELDLVPIADAVPLVTLAAAPPNPDAHYVNVDVDNEAGIHNAVAHLVSLGHQRIAHVTGSLEQYGAAVRRNAFHAATAAHGLAGDDAIVAIGSFFHESGLNRDAARMLLALPHPPTAIVCGNDGIARDVQQIAEALRLRIPDDLSLIGFDDAAVATLGAPALTTVRQPIIEIGRTAATLLLKRIEGAPLGERNVLLSPELIVRNSTAPPRK